MGAPRVLVVTADIDPTADHVVRHLLDRGVAFARIDGGHFPVELALAATLGTQHGQAHREHDGAAGGWSGSLQGLREVDLARVRSVYWRRPSPPRPAEDLCDGQRQWCRRQAKHALWGVLRALPARRSTIPQRWRPLSPSR